MSFPLCCSLTKLICKQLQRGERTLSSAKEKVAALRATVIDSVLVTYVSRVRTQLVRIRDCGQGEIQRGMASGGKHLSLC